MVHVAFPVEGEFSNQSVFNASMVCSCPTNCTPSRAGVQVRKRGIVPVYTRNRIFAKTGLEQLEKKLRKIRFPRSASPSAQFPPSSVPRVIKAIIPSYRLCGPRRALRGRGQRWCRRYSVKGTATSRAGSTGQVGSLVMVEGAQRQPSRPTGE